LSNSRRSRCSAPRFLAWSLDDLEGPTPTR
jgi:hypothetical protein